MTRTGAWNKVFLLLLLSAMQPLYGQAISHTTEQLILSANQYLGRDQPDSALMDFKKAIRQAKEKRQKKLLLQANLGMAETYFYLGDYPRTQDQLVNLIDLAQRPADRPYLLQAWLQWAELLFVEGNLPEAEGLLHKLENRAIPAQDQAVLAKAFNLLAKINSQQGNSTQANADLKKGKALALQLADKSLAIELLTQLATNYKNQDGALVQAQAYLEELIRLRGKTADKRNLIADHQELADLLQQTGDHPQAQAHLLQALKLAEAIQDTLQQMELLFSLGQGYSGQHQMASANAYLQRSLQMAIAKKNAFKTAEIKRLLGENLEKSGQQKQAQALYLEALAGFDALGNALECGRTLTLFHQADKARQALTYFQIALKAKIANQEPMGEVDIRLEMAKLQIELHDGAAALKSLQNCAELASLAGNRAYLISTWQSLAQAHALLGNYSAAYRFAEQHQNLKDSIFNAEQTRIISEMNARFDNVALRDSLQQAEIAQNKAALYQKTLLNYFFGAVLLAGALIAFLLFKNYRFGLEQRLQAQKLIALEKQRETDQLRAMIDGEEQERKRIAQELHDGLGTLLATVKLQFNAVQNERPGIEAVLAYQKADNLLDEACTEVRKISYNLMPAILQQYGLEYALQDLCEGINRSGQLEISFIPYGLEYTFNDLTAVSVYRIVQELVKNTLRHAEATELIVQLSVEDDQLNIVLEDNGQGFEPAEKLQNPGIGFQSIQSRLALLKGTIEITSKPGFGATFTIDIPLIPKKL